MKEDKTRPEMSEKPQFYIEIWCHGAKILDEPIGKIHRLKRVYSDKEDVEKHIIDILSNNVDFCKQQGNRKPYPGEIYNEQEYRQRVKGVGYTPR